MAQEKHKQKWVINCASKICKEKKLFRRHLQLRLVIRRSSFLCTLSPWKLAHIKDAKTWNGFAMFKWLQKPQFNFLPFL